MKKSYHISEFKKGDTLIRMNSAINYRTEFDEVVGTNVFIKERVDTSYSGIPLEYVGRTKKKIYFKSYLKEDLPFKPGKKFGIPYDVFQDGWTKYVSPIGLKELKGKFFNKEDLTLMIKDDLFNYGSEIVVLS